MVDNNDFFSINNKVIVILDITCYFTITIIIIIHTIIIMLYYRCYIVYVVIAVIIIIIIYYYYYYPVGYVYKKGSGIADLVAPTSSSTTRELRSRAGKKMLVANLVLRTYVVRLSQLPRCICNNEFLHKRKTIIID